MFGYIISLAIFVLLVYTLYKKWPYLLYINKAVKLMNEKQYADALVLLRKGVKYSSVNPMTKIAYAFNELKYGDEKTAKRELMLIMSDRKLKPNYKYEAKAIYALVQLAEGEKEDAEETLMEVYENYKNTNIYCSLGYLVNETKDYETALKFNLEAYEYNSDKAAIADNLGQCYYIGGEYDKAIKLYEELFAKETPSFPEAYYNYGRTLLAKGRKKDAAEMLEKALGCEFTRISTVTREEVEEVLNKIKE